ncbi:hypothetical protein KCU65_g9, partial [Aureobasidium melanogenum]
MNNSKRKQSTSALNSLSSRSEFESEGYADNLRYDFLNFYTRPIESFNKTHQIWQPRGSKLVTTSMQTLTPPSSMNVVYCSDILVESVIGDRRDIADLRTFAYQSRCGLCTMLGISWTFRIRWLPGICPSSPANQYRSM